MEAETEEFNRVGDHDGANAADAAREASLQARAAVSQEVHRLITDVESLIRRVGDAADPELRRLRAEVQSAIAATRRALADSARRAQHQAKEALEASDRYVRAQPWQTIGIAAVSGLFIGFLIGRR
jgi:ElaB protein